MTDIAKLKEDLTKADNEALEAMPNTGWFTATDRWSSIINRPHYRLERLERAGRIERRVTGVYPDLVSEYRKTAEKGGE